MERKPVPELSSSPMSSRTSWKAHGALSGAGLAGKPSGSKGELCPLTWWPCLFIQLETGVQKGLERTPRAPAAQTPKPVALERTIIAEHLNGNKESLMDLKEWNEMIFLVAPPTSTRGAGASPAAPTSEVAADGS